MKVAGIALFSLVAIIIADLPEIIRKEKGEKTKKELIAFLIVFALFVIFLTIYLVEEIK